MRTWYLRTYLAPADIPGTCARTWSLCTYLVLAEGEDERLEDEGEVGHELGAGFLLERGERRAGRLLHALVRVQDPLQQLQAAVTQDTVTHDAVIQLH